MTKRKELKLLLKAKAAYIRAVRQASKTAQRESKPYAGPQGPGLWKEVPEYRLHHIAYCLLRGTPYERIEPKVHEGNEPDFERIEAIKQQYTEVPDATLVCVGS